jgi:hypothetical protein
MPMNGGDDMAFFFPSVFFRQHERKKSLLPNRPGHLEYLKIMVSREIHGRFGTGLRPVSFAADPALSRKFRLRAPKTGNMLLYLEIRCLYWKPLPY